jgi:hypothetical protein
MSASPDKAEFRFEIAISFAGPHREKVRVIAERLSAVIDPGITDRSKGRVFFDEWFEYEILGSDMDLLLQNFYHKQSLMVVADVSEEYADRPWTQAEARAVRALRFELNPARDETARLRLLNAIFGPGEVPGVFKTEGILDAIKKSPEECADLILKRRDLLRERLPNAKRPDDKPYVPVVPSAFRRNWMMLAMLLIAVAVWSGMVVGGITPWLIGALALLSGVGILPSPYRSRLWERGALMRDKRTTGLLGVLAAVFAVFAVVHKLTSEPTLPVVAAAELIQQLMSQEEQRNDPGRQSSLELHIAGKQTTIVKPYWGQPLKLGRGGLLPVSPGDEIQITLRIYGGECIEWRRVVRRPDESPESREIVLDEKPFGRCP